VGEKYWAEGGHSGDCGVSGGKQRLYRPEGRPYGKGKEYSMKGEEEFNKKKRPRTPQGSN